jgi:hypothetical protein
VNGRALAEGPARAPDTTLRAGRPKGLPAWSRHLRYGASLDFAPRPGSAKHPSGLGRGPRHRLSCRNPLPGPRRHAAGPRPDLHFEVIRNLVSWAQAESLRLARQAPNLPFWTPRASPRPSPRHAGEERSPADIRSSR